MLEPEVPADRLHGGLNFYKIKLRSAGYRLVYEVEKGELVVYVFAVGKRERGQVYSRAFHSKTETVDTKQVGAYDLDTSDANDGCPSWGEYLCPYEVSASIGLT